MAASRVASTAASTAVPTAVGSAGFPVVVQDLGPLPRCLDGILGLDLLSAASCFELANVRWKGEGRGGQQGSRLRLHRDASVALRRIMSEASDGAAGGAVVWRSGLTKSAMGLLTVDMNIEERASSPSDTSSSSLVKVLVDTGSMCTVKETWKGRKTQN